MKKENLRDWIEAITSGVRGIIQNYQVTSAEKCYGCDFGGHILKKELGYADGQGYDYTPSFNHPRKYCAMANVSKDDIVMDLGCGKGYAMFLLGKYPFKYIYGIEKNANLAEIAANNCSKLVNSKRYKVIAEDAVDAFLKGESKQLIDQTTIFYVYNSFPKDIMKQVVEGIEHSVRDNPRDVKLWYAQPDKDCLEVVDARVSTGAWECKKRQRHLGQNIYEFKLSNKC